MKQLPIGISDYKTLVEENYYYIDKTLLIKELLDSGAQATLITRPRRFGKTLNLSMLRYFFEKTSNSNKHLFEHTALWQEEKYRSYHGQYPVIFLTFKDIKNNTFEDALEKIKNIIANEFERHSYLRTQLTERQEFQVKEIMLETASESSFEQALLLLSKLLFNYHKKKVIILIDEYDTPIHTAYNYNYYPKLISFLRGLLSSALKDNETLEKSVMTGILRTGKEGIFSGLNNLKVCTLNMREFQDKFGFTASEAKLLIKDQKLSDKVQEMKEWYNGYSLGEMTLYNPWSMIQCADQRGLLKTYWVNTSDNILVKQLIYSADEELKTKLEDILANIPIEEEIEDNLVFTNLEKSNKAIWTLLLSAGYLTYSKQELIHGSLICSLQIPNKEVRILYNDLLRNLFESSLSTIKTKQLFQAITQGQSKIFNALLQDFIVNSISYFDLPSNEPEKSYHLFVLGLLVQFSESYEVKSNRESGYGRYDIMLIPRKTDLPGIIMEFKKVSEFEDETLESAARNALEQIKEKNYAAQLLDSGVKKIYSYGISFEGKKVLIHMQ